MSNSITPGSSADVNVKVTALTTNPNVPVTYKTIILKKNLVNGVNTLTQDMISSENIKYVIKYDYVLGEDIAVPENCILEFDGGSISGACTISLNNTAIIASLNKIFNGVNFVYINESSLCKTDVYLDWFDTTPANIHSSLENATKIAKKLICSKGVYSFSTIGIGRILIEHDIIIKGNYATFVFESTALDNWTSDNFITHKKRLEVYDLNFIVYTKNEFISEGVSKQMIFFGTEFNYPSYDESCIIDNVNVHILYADSGCACLYCAYYSKKVKIHNCTYICDTPNIAKSGGSFAWFLLGMGTIPQTNIVIDFCNVQTNGCDEAIAINVRGNVASSKIVNTYITNSTFVRITDILGASGIINHVEVNDTYENNSTITFNTFVNNCRFEETGFTPILLHCRTTKEGHNQNINISNSDFIYSGTNTTFDDAEGTTANLGLIGGVTQYLNSQNIKFKNCKIQGKYIFISGNSNCNALFDSCEIKCDAFTGRRYPSQSFINNTNVRYINCNIHFNLTTLPTSQWRIKLSNCNIFAPNNKLNFWTNGYNPLCEIYNSYLNGLRIPDVDKYHIIASTSYNGGQSSFVVPESDQQTVFCWYNDTGEQATVTVYNPSSNTPLGPYIVENGEILTQKGFGLPISLNGYRICFTINNIKRYLWIGTLEDYNEFLLDNGVDKTSGKAILWNGTDWVDVTGTPV